MAISGYMLPQFAEPDPLRDPSKKIESLTAEGTEVIASLASRETVSFHRAVGKHLRVGDLVIQSVPAEAKHSPDILILKPGPRDPELLNAAIGYAAKPQLDKRHKGLIRTEMSQKSFGLNTLYISSDAVRDYFYAAQRGRKWEEQQTLYDLLSVNPAAKLGDLRLAFKVRLLEARVAKAPPSTLEAIERAFNVLAHPELRQIYAELLHKPGIPVLFHCPRPAADLSST